MRRSLRRARGNARTSSLRAVTLRLGAMAGVCVCLALSGCTQEKKAQGGPPPVPVVAQFAERMDVPVEIHAVGTVEPMNSVSVQSLVQGEITRVGFREGEDVRKGDMLFVIDPRPYQATLEQSRANLARDAAQAASAASNAARFEELVAKDYVTRQQADDARAAADAARAVLRADSAAVERAKLDLQNCTICAPISVCRVRLSGTVTSPDLGDASWMGYHPTGRSQSWFRAPMRKPRF
ncbi:MAG: efflux RND transporter periplasmic adaptor subunit, partial [Candidatus Eisenbacteria bacterium]|nr:efflux RND transporter periplasmic adaptor subunit [Candidatus Eisenbacteria bacterium]